MREALVFTRTKHRANRLQAYLVQHGVKAERIHGNRSQAQRTEALAGFKSGKYRVLVATDIAARGIDIEALGHVVNFDVPAVPEDYIHRVGRTARAEATGDAFTFVAPEEEDDLRRIEKAVGKRLPRVTVPDFDYKARAGGQARGADRPAHRRDPRPQGRGARPGARQRRAPRRRGHAAAAEPRAAAPRAVRAGPPAPGFRGGPAAVGRLERRAAGGARASVPVARRRRCAPVGGRPGGYEARAPLLRETGFEWRGAPTAASPGCAGRSRCAGSRSCRP